MKFSGVLYWITLLISWGDPLNISSQLASVDVQRPKKEQKWPFFGKKSILWAVTRPKSPQILKMSSFLLNMFIYHNSISFYVDLVQNAVIVNHIRGPLNKKCKITIIWGANFRRNHTVNSHNIKNDMYREKIELSEYRIRFGP